MSVRAGGSNAGRVGRLLGAGLAGWALLHVGGVEAQDARVDFTVSGTSTIRGWTCTVSGTADVTEGSAAAVPGLSDGVQAATLTVHVPSFECPQDEMREHLLEAMRAEEFEEIVFRLDGYDASGQGAVARGSLTILDATRPVSFPVTLAASGSGVQIQGELPLNMTEWGVEPPVVMLGLLRVRPDIRIQFSGMLNP